MPEAANHTYNRQVLAGVMAAVMVEVGLKPEQLQDMPEEVWRRCADVAHVIISGQLKDTYYTPSPQTREDVRKKMASMLKIPSSGKVKCPCHGQEFSSVRAMHIHVGVKKAWQNPGMYRRQKQGIPRNQAVDPFL
jgi:hypothetical protein